MRKIGKFEILGLLGRGGMSAVYKVRLPVVDKVVALKLLSPHPTLKALLGEEEVKRLFFNEARIIAGLRHPNIVDIKDFDQAGGRPYYTMEYYCNNLGLLMGETYQAEEPSRPFTLDRAVWYVSQILEGLDRLHQAGIVHRDIKPYNLLITDEDIVKISDFGLSLLRGEVFSGPPNLKVGSPFYAAPEQETDPDQADARADLYAVGVLLYRMLLGRLPLEIGKKPGRKPDLDEDWVAFLSKALAGKKEERFQTAREMSRGLEILEKSWEEKKITLCAAEEPETFPPVPPTGRHDLLRTRPVRVSTGEARAFFRLDVLWRPLTTVEKTFQVRDDGIVFDRTCGLIWQQNGSDYPLTWNEAFGYIERLNQSRFAGLFNWRLPTVDELCCLLKAGLGIEAYCLQPVFDQGKRSLWSADRRSYVAAWLVNVEMGFVAWQDFTCHNFVRAVSSGG